ncbi:DNA ligase [Streptomyces prunicolor]|uniref:ATP-dependent DNA ligase n=1 Tax=Streptomyces prunicolor TaxID=67348 RepID=UPI00225B2A12|nr:DNA ligase [Streptomyces prunicolor]MCX5239772.1 DNA ligase [Streptomyces prunicolor]
MEFPVEVALAQPVPTLPSGPLWWFEVKLDGHRTVLWRTGETVRLQARSGREVTSSWMDVAVAGMDLPPGTVLDGEAVVVVDGRISFEAAQSRAASGPARARQLAERYPALYIVWDVLALPSGDVRARPYVERRGLLLDVLESLSRPSPIQAVSATDDAEVAQAWYDTLQDTGVEGVVCKLAGSPYRPGRSSSWRKVRHAETVDADVVGFTGSAVRPRALVVRLPDGRTALTQALSAPLAAQVSGHIAVSGPSGRARTARGDVYATVGSGLVVEVLAGTSRHSVVSVTRLR